MIQTRLLASLLFTCAAGAVCLPVHAAPSAPAQSSAEQARWKASARRVTIMRDTWGIPHVFGKSDADAVFGLMYAQAEDDFNRVERNYINAMGRLAEGRAKPKSGATCA